MNRLDLKVLRDTVRRLREKKRIRQQTGRFPLEYILLYVTMRCNARCRHCFLNEGLNPATPDLALEQIERLAENAPHFGQLNLTGGEPTLRNDLLEIIGAFANRKRILTVAINTNGLLTERCLEMAMQILTRWPQLNVVFQVSIDGLPETHDRLRGVPGIHQKATDTLRGLMALRRENPKLHPHVLTVIMDENYNEIRKLDQWLRENVASDIKQGFELVRDVDACAWNIPPAIREEGVGPKAPALPPREDFNQIRRDLIAINKKTPNPANTWIVHNLAQLSMVETGEPEFRCITAGETLAVVYSNGDVTHCEFTKPFANLRDYDYDFNALWNGEAAEKQRGRLGKCWCTHACWHGTSVDMSWKGIWRAFKHGLH